MYAGADADGHDGDGEVIEVQSKTDVVALADGRIELYRVKYVNIMMRRSQVSSYARLGMMAHVA